LTALARECFAGVAEKFDSREVAIANLKLAGQMAARAEGFARTRRAAAWTKLPGGTTFSKTLLAREREKETRAERA